MNLYLRLLKLLLMLPFLRRRGLFDAASVRFRVWPPDCDINIHLNDSRYFSFMDLGRLLVLAQTGLLNLALRRRWQIVLAAADINYIRALKPFEVFTLTTRFVTWDEKYFYFEQRFAHRGEPHAVALAKVAVLQHGARVAPSTVLAASGADTQAPDMPAVMRHWKELTALKKNDRAGL